MIRIRKNVEVFHDTTEASCIKCNSKALDVNRTHALSHSRDSSAILCQLGHNYSRLLLGACLDMYV